MVSLLASLLFLSLVVWVGGAVTGQLLFAQTREDGAFTVRLVRAFRWLIVWVYIPAASIAAASAVGLALSTGVSLATWWVALPLVMYVGLAVMGGVYSLPTYDRLIRDAEAHGTSAAWYRTLWRAVWVNRIELALFAVAFLVVIVQVTRPT